jgi:hypothetical protein
MRCDKGSAAAAFESPALLERFTETELFRTVASISYMGATRAHELKHARAHELKRARVRSAVRGEPAHRRCSSMCGRRHPHGLCRASAQGGAVHVT